MLSVYETLNRGLQRQKQRTLWRLTYCLLTKQKTVESEKGRVLMVTG